MASEWSEELLKLREQYQLSDEDFTAILAIIVEEVADGYLPSPFPKVVILGGAPGSGKTELQKEAESLLRGNAVICNADNLRDFHPLSHEIKRNHPSFYPDITAEYAQKWNDLLCNYCQQKRLNYILETTFSSGARLQQTIREIKDVGYQVDIMLLAVSPRLSLLGTYIRYENSIENQGLGRKVSKEAHDVRFNAIPSTIDAITKNQLFDDIRIYSRSVVLEYANLIEGVTLVAHNPVNVLKVYQEEIERPCPLKLKEYFKQSYSNVFEMMRKRQAHPREIERFRNELGIIMPPSQKRGRRM
ncbi:zeta toxin family protein [Chryseobacterium camelliae]|uniref:Zeta toxin family protein n=1 Tax=Chryseobacterium camelliae TaxID=1265445 RepID=A0ABY7QLS1_9FLAO|nr:zeta toxin family protein [Chryseobacterium camelliae]WBV60631.1 zeta toxin family protein [Chryseobacterium camelliae]